MHTANRAFAWLALACTPAHAQDAITLYGMIDMGLVREAGGKDGAVTVNISDANMHFFAQACYIDLATFPIHGDVMTRGDPRQ